MRQRIDIEFGWEGTDKTSDELALFIQAIRQKAAAFKIKFHEESKTFEIFTICDESKTDEAKDFLYKYKFSLGGRGTLSFQSYPLS